MDDWGGSDKYLWSAATMKNEWFWRHRSEGRKLDLDLYNSNSAGIITYIKVAATSIASKVYFLLSFLLILISIRCPL